MVRHNDHQNHLRAHHASLPPVRTHLDATNEPAAAEVSAVLEP